MERRASPWYIDVLKAVGLYVLIEGFTVVWEHGFRAPLAEVKDAIRFTAAMFLVLRYSSMRSRPNSVPYARWILWGLVGGVAVALVNAGIDHWFAR